MRAAILCPGPSLPAFPARDGYDLVIGVNRAVGFAACDYWVMLDGAAVWRISRPIGMPVIVCSHSMHLDVWRNYPESQKHGWLDAKSFEQFASPSLGWPIYSTPTAIICAASKGATQIDLWGADMVGAGEFDNKPAPDINREDSRWARERVILDGLQSYLEARGVALNRKGVNCAHPL